MATGYDYVKQHVKDKGDNDNNMGTKRLAQWAWHGSKNQKWSQNPQLWGPIKPLLN